MTFELEDLTLTLDKYKLLCEKYTGKNKTINHN